MRIEVVRDSVADPPCRLFVEQRPAYTGLDEEELIEKIANCAVARLPTPPKPQPQGEKRYVRKKEAAASLGVSVRTLRGLEGQRVPSATSENTHGTIQVYLASA